MSVDWSAYRKCRVCPAALGEACFYIKGVWVGGRLLTREVPVDKPHAGRELRSRRGA